MSSLYSYLGNGLFAARFATLGALGADGRVSYNFNHLSCYSFINVLISRQKSLFLMFVFPGLDWKVFSSSCLPKKFRENVTFSGTTYKVSGIPDGKIKAV